MKSEHMEERTGNLKTWFPLYFQHIPHTVILAVSVQIPRVSVKPQAIVNNSPGICVGGLYDRTRLQ